MEDTIHDHAVPCDMKDQVPILILPPSIVLFVLARFTTSDKEIKQAPNNAILDHIAIFRTAKAMSLGGYKFTTLGIRRGEIECG